MSTRYCALLFALACSALPVGCAQFDTSHAVSYTERSAPPAELDEDSVQIYQAFLERPLDDEYLGRDVWLATDQHVLGIERQAALEENGFRIGQLVGGTPGKLMELLKSKRACIDGKMQVVRCGELATHLLGSVHPRSTFQTVLAGKREEVTLEEAQFCLDMSATLTKDQGIELNFTPRARHHRDDALAVAVEPDYSGWKAAREQLGRSFAPLGWRVTLSAGQTLLIGPNLEKTGSLGYRAFVQDDVATPVQRVLILRCNRATVTPRSTVFQDNASQVGTSSAM